ncbi:MAG: four helix bundle protein [Pirellulales bacterium]|nr:four helix bundle protein [Pirellulales bacterium]
MASDIRSYRQLIVWQKSMDAVVKVYELTREFPNHELYCLTSQIRRAAISIPSNIAEGNARASSKDYLNFLAIAQGSLAELETQLELAKRLQYSQPWLIDDLCELLTEVDKMLAALRNSLQRKN